MTFSVNAIVVTYNSGTTISLCLCFLKDALEGVNGNIVIVDNNSKDDTIQKIRQVAPEAQILQIPRNLGLAKALNIAAKRTSSKYFLTLNPDTNVTRSALQEMLTFAESHPKAGVIAPKLLYPNGELQYSCRRFSSPLTDLARRTPFGKTTWGKRILSQFLMLDYAHDIPNKVPWTLEAAMLVRRKAFDEIGGLDERFFLYCEDEDLCERIWLSGWEVWYIPHVKVIHAYERASRGLNLLTLIHINSAMRLLLKRLRRRLMKLHGQYVCIV